MLPGPDRRPHPRYARGLPLLGPGRAIRPHDLACRPRSQQYRDKVAELEDGRWIWTNAGGWNINQFDDPRPFTFEELTAIAPKNPMWVAGSGFTGPRVNQAAFDLLGLTASSPGVEVVNGQVTGRLTGAASAASNDAIRAQLDTLGIDGEAKCLASFIREANSRGLTAIKDAGGNRAPWSTDRLHQPRPALRGADPRVVSQPGTEPADRLQRHGQRVRRHRVRARVAVTEIAEGFAGDDYLRYLGPGEDRWPRCRATRTSRATRRKRLSVETHVGGNIDNIIAGMKAADDEVYDVGKLKWRIAHPNAGEPTDDQITPPRNSASAGS